MKEEDEEEENGIGRADGIIPVKEGRDNGEDEDTPESGEAKETVADGLPDGMNVSKYASTDGKNVNRSVAFH